MKTLIISLLACAVPLVSVVTASGADLAAGDVRHAIEQGVRYLKSSQRADNGTWPDHLEYQGGVTALCTLALLNAGESPAEEHVQKALAYLRNLDPKSTYVVSLQTMVLCRATPAHDQFIIERNVHWLENVQLKTGDECNGGWAYPEHGGGDGSNSQFALLALYEAARAAESGQISLTINRDTWKSGRNYWSANQKGTEDARGDTGAWGYYKNQPGTGSMTCAGISSLVIANDVLHEPDARVSGDQIDGCYRPFSEDYDRIDRAIEWLRRKYTILENPPPTISRNRLWHYYFLYGLERAGRLSSRRKIGEHDWYREGAAWLVTEIGGAVSRNSWRGSGHAEENPDIATALALLFLSKGRWPVLMAKVQYQSPAPPLGPAVEKDVNWNRHRSDVKNLTFFVESKWQQDLATRGQRELTWQVLDLKKASVDDLLQVPVLFFSGGGDPLPEKEVDRRELAGKLRDYVDRGGFIFADGDPCSTGFDKGFRKLMELVFEKPEYRFKKLDESHPIWTADQKVPPNQVRLLLGIDYGCRTSVIYAPCDPPRPGVPGTPPNPSLACLWELSRGGPRDKYSPAVQEKIRGGLAIGANVLAYATNRELKEKSDIEAHLVDKEPRDSVRGKFAVAKLRHPGGCDAAPRALANLMEQAGHELKIRVETHPKLIGMQDPALFDYPVVFMHGRNAFHLTEGERKALREYVERGGLLFADAICGNEAFGESFRNEMKLIFPKNPLENISPKDPMWTTRYGGADLHTVMRRDPQPRDVGQTDGPPKSTLRAVPPELKGVRFGDRYGVIFSEFDLSCALERHESAECRGYTREDAARIGLNVLLYGMQH